MVLKIGNFLVASTILLSLFVPFSAGAQQGNFGDTNNPFPSPRQTGGDPSARQTGSDPPPGQTGSNYTTLGNPLNVDSFCGLLKAIFAIAVQIGVPIAVVFVVFAGFKFVLARGNPEGLKRAKSNLMYTLIGIALFFGAWFLAQIITNTLVELGQTLDSDGFNTCV